MLTTIRDIFLVRRREIIFAAVIFLTAALSFGLGYLADRTFNHAPIIIEACANH